MRIYMCGFINGKKIKECLKWREEIKDHFYMNPKWHNELVFLNPLNGKSFENMDDTGLKGEIPGKALIHRDFKCVKESDLIVANLNTFGESRPPIGSLYELAWAWTLEKPVILITEGFEYKEHPFILDTVSIFVKNVQELLDKKYIQYFYRGLVTACE